MSDNERALRLEALLPEAARSLYRPEAGDPLSELSLGQMRIVRILFTGRHTVSSLSEELGMSISAATQMIGRLEGLGLIEKVDDLQDRRVRNLNLTPHGLNLMNRRRDRRVERVRQVLSKMTQSQQQQIIDALETLVAECRRSASETPESKPTMLSEIEQELPAIVTSAGEDR